MLGITLTIDQIRNAPPPVRQWIEKEVTAALGLSEPPLAPSATVEPSRQAHMVSCSVEDAEAILAKIEAVLPAVNVFFEFGRPAISYGNPPVMAFRLLDMMYHTRLDDVGQVVACLEMIDEALATLRGDSSARFCGFDHEGHCFIPAQTHESIAALWQKIAARQQKPAQTGDRPLSSAA
ncbi:MAG TPA: hypothetical protein VFL62_09315 [Bradyrhizobium sp.]|uniref:hypothetical protein n=1 Tax=Bradyrhizobium sp. TaxID=376 RepID=UPI002D80EA41|nr:hypothetical protein [Bradyrhizobium sp.]HET7886411.1 hypothetical protein [Bradyrhizobium sp.]